MQRHLTSYSCLLCISCHPPLQTTDHVHSQIKSASTNVCGHMWSHSRSKQAASRGFFYAVFSSLVRPTGIQCMPLPGGTQGGPRGDPGGESADTPSGEALISGQIVPSVHQALLPRMRTARFDARLLKLQTLLIKIYVELFQFFKWDYCLAALATQLYICICVLLLLSTRLPLSTYSSTTACSS